MVSLPSETEEVKKRIPGAVCPNCYRPLPYPNTDPPYTHGGHTFRMVQGWCFDCVRGYITIQFQGLSGQWILHKCMSYDLIDNVPRSDARWTEIVPLPAAPDPSPPLVKLGPGGDYTQTVSEADVNETAMLGKLADILASCRAVIESLLQRKNAQQDH